MAYSKTLWKDRVVQNPRTYTQVNNADGSITLTPKEGTITEPGTPLSSTNLNNIENGIATVELSSLILTVGGSANAITLSITLSDKAKYSFKAVSNSTGSVTVNGIALKKLDGTIVNNIKANKVYDIFYDQSQNSVFILAKASGTAQVGDVLAGKTFSNDSDTDLIGTATIASLGGKRWASGSVLSSTSNRTFVNTYGQDTSYPYVAVTGLSFAPKSVMIWGPDGFYNTFCSKESNAPKNSGVDMIMIYGASTPLKLTGQAVLGASNFLLPVLNNDTTYQYIVFE